MIFYDSATKVVTAVAKVIATVTKVVTITTVVMAAATMVAAFPTMVVTAATKVVTAATKVGVYKEHIYSTSIAIANCKAKTLVKHSAAHMADAIGNKPKGKN